MVARIPRLVLEFIQSGAGSTAVEYGLIATLVIFVIVGSVGLLGGDVQRLYTAIASNFPS
jgi:Flp pilus assembly pilin Flp